MSGFKTGVREFKKLVFSLRFWELFPLVLIVSVLPLFHGGESELARIVFWSFPIFYMPMLTYRKRKLVKGFKYIFWVWVVYLIVNSASIPLSASIALSVPQFMKLVGMLVYFCLFYLVVEKKSDLKMLAYFLIGVGVLLSLMSFYFIVNAPGDDFPGMNLVWAKYGHNHLADYLLLILPGVIISFLKARTKQQKVGWGLLSGFFLISFWLTFSRGAFVVMATIFLSIIWLYKKQIKRLLVVAILVLMPLVFIIGSLMFSAHKVGQDQQFTQKVKKVWVLRQVVKPINREGRLEYWRQAIEGFKLRPTTGNGVGTFRLTSKRFQKMPETNSWFAHNNILQAASETGVIGVAGYVVLLGMCIKQLQLVKLFRRKGNDHMKALVLGLGAVLMQSMVDFNLDFLAINLLFWVIVASSFKVNDYGKSN